jgi:hypothetical protein
VIARYIRKGDKIMHPTRGKFGTVVTVQFHEPGTTPGRPWGVVSGWMSNPDNPKEQWGWNYPTDSIVLCERSGGAA